MTDEQSDYSSEQRYRSIGKDIVSQVHEYGLDLECNHLYLMPNPDYTHGMGEALDNMGVEYSMANRFIKSMNILMRRDTKCLPILIHMSTCGGCFTEGMAIYNMIRACPNQVTILNYGDARSMSSVILQAADKRVMMPHNGFMFHLGYLGSEGPNTLVYTDIEQCKKSDTIMLDIYVDKMKQSGKFKKWSKIRIKEMLVDKMKDKLDVWLTSSETVDWGLADEVFGEPRYDWDKLTEF